MTTSRNLFLCAAAAFAALSGTISAQAESTQTVNGVKWTYKTQPRGALVTKAEPASGNMVVPDALGGKPTTSLMKQVFWNCTGLTGISLPNSVQSIGDYAFNGCSKLQSASLGTGLKTIGLRAFFQCYALASISFPAGLKDIGKEAFYMCRGLPGVSIPDSVTNIGACAFAYCDGLEHLSLGAGVRSIGDGAFCGSPARVGALPEGLEKIGADAFLGCDFQSVTIPASVSSIGEGAFSANDHLPAISVAAGNTHYMAKDGVLFTKDGKTLLVCPGARSGTYQVPSSVRRVGNLAFSGTVLSRVVVPDTVAELGESVFRECPALTSVVLPSGLKAIGPELFEYCPSLVDVELPAGLDNIPGWVFEGCKRLESLTIPAGVTNIGYMAFGDCQSLKQLEIPPKVKAIGEYAFRGSGLESLVIPPSVQSVGEKAFQKCNAMKTLYVPASWKGTTKLAKTELPATCEIVYYKDMPQTVWRFYSKKYKGHFFTISAAEKETLRTTNPNWKFEAGAYRAYTNQAAGTTALYRFYSKKYQGHFFTVDVQEAEEVKKNPNWKYEGIAYYVYANEASGTVPVYRFWSKGYKHHFYTIDEEEKDNLIATNPNWKYERIAFYALALEDGEAAGAAKGTRAMEPVGLEQVEDGETGDGDEEETATRAGRPRKLGARAARPRVAVTTSDGSDGSAVADGDEGTGWSPEGTGAGWVVLSFAEPAEVGSVEVVGENLPVDFHVLWSEDAVTWEEEAPMAAARYVWVAWSAGATGSVPVVNEVWVRPRRDE